MAEIDFPDSPAPGEVYDQWTWNGELWTLTQPDPLANDGGSGFTFVQDGTPPANQIGDTWYETDTGDSFVWTDDGTSQQWVQFAPGGGGGGGGGDGGSGFTFVQDTQPNPTKVGDTWFDLSTAATGGTSWVAVEEGLAGSELVWVQFAPGTAAGIMPTGFVRRNSVAQIIPPAAWTPLTYDTVIQQRGLAFATTDNKNFTVPIDGIYSISTMMAAGGSAFPAGTMSLIRANTVALTRAPAARVHAYENFILSFTQFLAAGTAIDVIGYHEGTANYSLVFSAGNTIDPPAPLLSVWLVG